MVVELGRRSGLMPEGWRCRVTFYCPDDHVLYDGTTPRESGIGGGITARVRAARALAALGHEVTIVANCPRCEERDGVRWIPLPMADYLDGDVLILNTSGGQYDLSPFRWLPNDFRLRGLWVSGADRPAGLEHLDLDFVYPKSNFLNRIVAERWELPGARRFVIYNGYDESLYQVSSRSLQRDPYRLLYLSHPSKGLQAALAVTRRLREVDSRFHLDVYGGEALWGQPGLKRSAPEGVRYRGLIGQSELTVEMLQSSVAICLQDREEPFGMVVIEAQRAGMLVVASAVGAHPELIQDGLNGLLLSGPASAPETISAGSSAIATLVKDGRKLEDMRKSAAAVPWSDRRLAETWSLHWDMQLVTLEMAANVDATSRTQSCRNCGSFLSLLSGDLRCYECGYFEPRRELQKTVK